MPLFERGRVLRWWKVSGSLSWHPVPGMDPLPVCFLATTRLQQQPSVLGCAPRRWELLMLL